MLKDLKKKMGKMNKQMENLKGKIQESNRSEKYCVGNKKVTG